jgi:dTDP-4-dehydrorhamnose reductase
MKITLNQSDIADLLREDDNASWSYKGANVLAEHLDENHDLDEEFCVAEIRGEYSEYDSAHEAAEDCGYEGEVEEDERSKNQLAYEWLESKTLVLEIEDREHSYHSGGGVIIRSNF